MNLIMYHVQNRTLNNEEKNTSITVIMNQINPSKKVWKSEFVHQLLSYLTNIWRIIGIIIKIVELSLKWYPTYYDYLWHGSAMLKNVGQGYRWKAAKCLKFRKSFTVWKSEFNHLLLVYSSKSQQMLKTIIKIVKLSLKW